LREGSFADGPDDQPVDRELLVARGLTDGEHRDHLRDGRRMLAHYLRRPGGGRVGLSTDVTAIKRAAVERRSLEGRQHQSQRLEALGTLAGGIAHDLNNALLPHARAHQAGRAPAAGRQSRAPQSRNRRAGPGSGARPGQAGPFSRNEEQRREGVDFAAVIAEALQAAARVHSLEHPHRGGD
jgi:hypothetical protein